MLFICKPLYRDFYHFIKRIFKNIQANISSHLKVCNMNGDGTSCHIQAKRTIVNQNTAIVANDTDIVSYQRCGGVHIRPYVRWHNKSNVNINIDPQDMRTIMMNKK